MATHSHILDWKIPWTEEPGTLQSMESQKSWTQFSDYNNNNKSSHYSFPSFLYLSLYQEIIYNPWNNIYTHTHICMYVCILYISTVFHEHSIFSQQCQINPQRKLFLNKPYKYRLPFSNKWL